MKSMNKKFFYIIILMIIVIGVIYLTDNKNKVDTDLEDTESASVSLLNGTYTINNQSVTLNDGYAEEVIPNSNAKIITRYFGNEVSGDFNHDGFTDAAFLVTQDLSGSGTFYYLTVALGKKGGYTGTNAILLGDRISPQTTNLQDGKIIVNFAERKLDEPMTTPPSIGVSRFFIIDKDQLIETSQGQ